MPSFISTLAFRLIAAGVIVLILLFAVSQCTGQRKVAEQAKQDARSSNATAETAKDAAATVIKRADEDASVDELIEATAKEIDNAKTPEDAGRAARAAVCRMPNYRNDPTCKL